MKEEIYFKSNTCTSLPITDLIDAPNISNLIYSISKLLSNDISEEKYQDNTSSPEYQLYLFSEDYYINEYPHNFDYQKVSIFKMLPSCDDISLFLKGLFLVMELSPECLIISLIYLNRFLAITNSSLTQSNWRPVLLFCVIIAHKVWDEKFCSNYEVSKFYPFFEKTRIDQLETTFLQLINYNLRITLSSYISYFMELKSMNPIFTHKIFNVNKISVFNKKQLNFVNNLKKKSRTFI